MTASGYRRIVLQCAVAAVALNYAIVGGMYLVAMHAFGLHADDVASLLAQTGSIASVLGPAAGLVVWLLIPERSPWRWCYAAIAVLGFLSRVAVPVIVTT